MEKMKIVLLILVVMIIIGGITVLHFFTDSFPGSDPLNAIDFIEPKVILTPGQISCSSIAPAEDSILPAADCFAR